MQMFRRKNKKGFTMIELMVVVVIVGVLAAIAIPIYGKYIKNARVTEATGRVGEILTACKAYAIENQNSSGVAVWPTGAVGVVDLTASDNFTYALSPAPVNPNGLLSITATGTNKMSGVTVVVTCNGVSATASVPAVTGL